MELDYLAVLVAAVVGFGVGALWYSPVLFIKAWQDETGITDEMARQANPARTFGISFVIALVGAAAMDMFLDPASMASLAAPWRGCALGWCGLEAPLGSTICSNSRSCACGSSMPATTPSNTPSSAWCWGSCRDAMRAAVDLIAGDVAPSGTLLHHRVSGRCSLSKNRRLRGIAARYPLPGLHHPPMSTSRRRFVAGLAAATGAAMFGCGPGSGTDSELAL